MNWGMKCETSVLQNIFYNTMLFDKEGAKGRRKHMTHSRTMWQGADGEDSAAFPNKVSSATFFTWSCALINAHCWDDMFLGSFLNLFRFYFWSTWFFVHWLHTQIHCLLPGSPGVLSLRIDSHVWHQTATLQHLLMPEAALQKGTDTAKIVN